ncbi:hypothetical protein J3Q64DRAFT_1638524 [Phycomyces blakesleeanus]|uniref:Reverse transcriptase domain-containing protein n=1 Tax=Phycomyces blakesleeanus TaxID=4837 RepID=A0ABR3B2L4_PHYBL
MLLPTVEMQVASLQEGMSCIASLRAGRIWQENGEKAAGFLKPTIATQESWRAIPALIHLETQTLCSSHNTKTDASQFFYTRLYTKELTNNENTEQLLSNLLVECRLSNRDQDILLQDFTLLDIQEGVSCSPRQSSSGTDGLPYEMLKLLFTHLLYSSLIVKVYKNALQEVAFPTSWSDTCMTLLPKKGNLSDLANWRPISLINTDAKVFT